MIIPGRRSKLFLTISSNSLFVFADVPYAKTAIDNGSATAILYDTWTRQRRQSFALTNDLATHRAAYAPDRSTFDGSLPLNAPPPWAPHPP